MNKPTIGSRKDNSPSSIFKFLSFEPDGNLTRHCTNVRLLFGPKCDEVIGGWRKLHNEELHNVYSSPSIIRMINSRRMIWAGHVARTGEKRNGYRISVGKPEGKRPLGIHRRRREDTIKMDLREIG
jgi:hypothetical protein